MNSLFFSLQKSVNTLNRGIRITTNIWAFYAEHNSGQGSKEEPNWLNFGQSGYTEPTTNMHGNLSSLFFIPVTKQHSRWQPPRPAKPVWADRPGSFL